MNIVYSRTHLFVLYIAGTKGIEPLFSASKALVQPLDDIPKEVAGVGFAPTYRGYGPREQLLLHPAIITN